jgi:CHAT domain-containing protein/Tfp pilus assembly protein PilF
MAGLATITDVDRLGIGCLSCTVPLTSNRGRRPLLGGCVLTVALSWVPREGATQDLSGIVVERVDERSAGQRAGLLPGDVLTSWERRASPPANPSAAKGDIATPFDLDEIEIEQAPRANVTLAGRRGTERLAIDMPAGRWRVSARPVMPPASVERVTAAREAATGGRVDAAVSDFKAAAARAGDTAVAAWLLIQASAALADARRPAEAHAVIREAAVVAGGTGDRAAIAGVLEAQAQLYERSNDATNAEIAYRAVIATRQGGETANLGTAKGLVDLGFVAIGRGDLAAAEPRIREAAELQRRLAPGSVVLARSLSNLGRLVERGDPDAAAPLYREAMELLERLLPNSDDHGNAVNNLGTMYWRRGDLRAASDLLTRAHRIHEQLAPDSQSVAMTLHNLGHIASDRGRLAESDDLYRRALATYGRLAPGSLDEANVRASLATLLMERGDLSGAEDHYLQSLSTRDRLLPNSLEVAGLLNNLGQLSSRRGDAVRARDYYDRSLALSQKLAPDSIETAATLNNLGNLAAERGDLVEAASFLERSLAIKQRVAPDSRFVASSLSNLGDLARQRDDLDAAHASYQTARAIYEQIAPEGLELAEVLGNLADLADRRGDAAEATRLSERALASVEALAPGSEAHAAALQRIGRRAVKQNDLTRAATYFGRAVDAYESQAARLGGSDEARTLFAGQGREYYGAYVDALMALDRPTQAFEVLERSRARSLLAMLAQRDLVLDGDLSPDLRQALQDLGEQYDQAQAALADASAGDVATRDRLRTTLRDLQESRGRIIERVRAASPRLGALRYPTPLTLDQVRSTLEPGTVMLSYEIGVEASRVFVVRRSATGRQPDLVVHPIAIGEADLRERAAAFRRLIERDAGSTTGAAAVFVEQARALYDLLVAPVERDVAGADRVLIVPDGPLHVLPFSALARPTGNAAPRPWQYFAEWKPLHTTLSATVYAELRRGPVAGSQRSTLVAFGDPLYPEAAATDTGTANPDLRAMRQRGVSLTRLPATRSEVQALARAFGSRASVYLGSEATEEQAKSVAGTRYLHLATHGVLDARLPLNSALALSLPAERRPGQENGLLQAWEIFEQVRLDADLVTLSACETALGAELAGEGLIGLTRAFHYAGARSVLASLWRVADDSTSDLMTEVYAQLRAGVSKDEALRRAQRKAIARPETAAPFHWAAFTLSGDWR